MSHCPERVVAWALPRQLGDPFDLLKRPIQAERTSYRRRVVGQRTSLVRPGKRLIQPSELRQMQTDVFRRVWPIRVCARALEPDVERLAMLADPRVALSEVDLGHTCQRVELQGTLVEFDRMGVIAAISLLRRVPGDGLGMARIERYRTLEGLLGCGEISGRPR